MKYFIRFIAFAMFYLVVGGLTSGRWDWLGSWLYTFLFAGGIGAQFVLLSLVSPELLKERSADARNAKNWDRLLMPLTVMVLPLAALVVAGLDLRFGWTRPLRVSAQLIGAAAGAASYGLTLTAMGHNRFFSMLVRIQTERGHQVETSGPYRWVRHPGYLGILGFFCATPLALGSVSSGAPAFLAVALHLLRTALEDRTLMEELPGYQGYAERVRFRLIPGIW